MQANESARAGEFHGFVHTCLRAQQLAYSNGSERVFAWRERKRITKLAQPSLDRGVAAAEVERAGIIELLHEDASVLLDPINLIVHHRLDGEKRRSPLVIARLFEVASVRGTHQRVGGQGTR